MPGPEYHFPPMRLSLGETHTLYRRFGSGISFRSATVRACSNTPSIQYQTDLMATVPTTTLARCCSQACLRTLAKCNCPNPSPPALLHLSNMLGTQTPV